MGTQNWDALTKLTAGARFQVERVRLTGQDVAIEGRFEPPALAQLAADDQIFVAAFVRCHGSIKEMEKFFGVSYPTIKNRLNRIGALLPFAEIDPEPDPERSPSPSTADLLSQLERGTLSVDEVVRQLRRPEDRK